MSSIQTPILFLVFNRPDTTKLVFEAIRQAKPAKLYLAADGPRPDNEGEKTKVEDVRKIATKVDWDSEVKTLFRDQNLGCKMAVSSAISWFFEHEEEGIILEDDCLPDPSFFPYCVELLERYRHDTRIMALSGDNFQRGNKRIDDSYYFSRYPHCWGWATWKRAWSLYNGDLLGWPELKEKRFLADICNGNDEFDKYWSSIYDKCFDGNIDSWAYPWTYSCWVQSGLSILPNVNLVSNIGFGEDSTHTKGEVSGIVSKTGEMVFPLRHPEHIIRDTQADRYTDRYTFNISQPSCGEGGKKNSMLNFLAKHLKHKSSYL